MFPAEARQDSFALSLKAKSAPRPTGHDAVLSSIRKDGREITVVKSDGTKVIGRLVASDKFSLSIDDREHVRVVFKHAIDEFYAAARVQ